MAQQEWRWTARAPARIIAGPCLLAEAAMSTPSLGQFQREIGMHLGRGEISAAAAAAARCRQAWPADRTGWLFGSIAALLADDSPLALALIEAPAASDPGDLECLLQKAECLLALGRRAEALALVDAAAERAQSPAALDVLADFLTHAGEHRRALCLYDKAIAAAPNDPTLRAKRADTHRFLGNFDLAAGDFEAILAQFPAAPQALKGLVDLRRQTPERNAVASLEKALAAAPAGSADAALLHFALAKSYEDLGDHAGCWPHLSAGNRAERRRIQYDSTVDRAVVERMMAAFADQETHRPDTTGERPIFIVGLPRSGTTLIDRILGNHSAVHSAGELTAMTEAVEVALRRAAGSGPAAGPALQGPRDALRELDERQIALEYLARAQAQRGDRPRFTDKLPTNFLNCALILRAFPNAHIVHVTRHPLAACFAIFATRFDGTYPFAYDLGEIGEFYVAYRELMAHWHRVLPGRIIDVAYEDVVMSLEPTTRRLLDHLGLPFEAACLEFHSNPAPVRTKSAVQVRQPLYNSSLHRWRAHAHELAPLRARLEAAGIELERPQPDSMQP